MKKARIFSAISLMLLSICILGAGVYAANSSDRYMGISGGVIQVPVNLLGVSVKGYIGAVDETPDFSSTYTSEQEDKVWNLLKDDNTPLLVFDAKQANDPVDVAPITLTFVITNESDVALEAYFYDSNDASKTMKDQDYLGGNKTESNYVVGVELGSNDLSAATYKEDNTLDQAGTCTITITFNLNQLIDDGGIFDFGYVLQVSEKNG